MAGNNLVAEGQAAAVAIVLAGGGSTRLAALGLGPGGKAALPVAGQPCLVRVCRAVATIVPRVVVVAAAGQPLPALPDGVEVVRDRRPAGGPLAGLCDGLTHVAAGPNPPRLAFVASCDVPLLAPAVVARLLAIAGESRARVVVPVVAGHPQVLVSVIECGLLPVLSASAAAGHGPRRVLADLLAEAAPVRLVAAAEFADIDPGLTSFLDLDTPADMTRLEAAGIPPSRP
ncbi:MAG: molybdenum cofactor guanylyltransferase [Pirellulales bacterium]